MVPEIQTGCYAHPDLKEWTGMETTKKRYSAELKAKVAMEAIRSDLTLAELSEKHGIHHTMIGAWKRQAMEGMASLFDDGDQSSKTASEAEIEKLQAKIGQLLVERDFLARASGRRAWPGGDRRSSQHTSTCRSRCSAACCRSVGRPITTRRCRKPTTRWR